jgi:hypothetical protein
MLGWSLPSNSGRFEATWSVAEPAGDHLTCDFQLLARSYNTEPAGPIDEKYQLLFSFPGLVLRVSELLSFARDLERWCTLPLAELRDTQLVAEAELGGRHDEYLRLRFGPKPDSISEGHPFALFEYAIAGVSGTFSYAADQSCVGSLFAGISATLESLAV